MPAIPGFLKRHRAFSVALLVAVTGALAWTGYRYFHAPPKYKGSSRISINMRKPEMLLATRSLSQLPKDIAAAPALQGLVDQELVFHYEEDEARLSVEGSLRRLAYEHDLEIQDRFLAALLDAPAEIGLWRSSKGRPEYFVAAIERGTLARLTETFAKISLDDRQLKQAGTFSVGGSNLPLYTLEYGGGRALAFIGAGERWIFLSDPALALDAQGKLTADAADIIDQLLRGKHPWRESLPPSASAKHSLVVGAPALTMGYARFLPALTGLRMDFDEKGWQPSLRVDAKALPEHYDVAAGLNNVWRKVPASGALCAAMPVDWKAAAAPLKTLLGADGDKLQPTVDALDPVGAVCWYAGSRLAAPLFVVNARTPLPADSTALLALLAQKSWAGTQQGAGERYSATVPSYHGVRSGAGESAFQPTLAREGQLILFSPDKRNVDAALAVAAKKAPAAGDLPALQQSAWLMYDPGKLSRLVRAEVQEVLPADEESFFRDVARTRLWPRLDAWGQKQTATALVAGGNAGDGFVALDSRALSIRKPGN